jgi:3-hydroxybutyryl-CoA dehydrogenase
MVIGRVCVLGMGTMGSQIGIVCARGGYETAMVDTSTQLVEKGLNSIQSFLKGQVKKGRMGRE